MQRTPTSFNAQPYAVIAVKEAKQRAALAQTMLGRNGERVETAPVTLVFAADLGMQTKPHTQHTETHSFP